MEALVKRCSIEHFRSRYQRSSKGRKDRILREVCEKLGVCRRQARRLMEPSRKAGKCQDAREDALGGTKT